MLSLLGAGAVCQDTPVDGPTLPPGIDGCAQASPGGFGVIQLKSQTFPDWQDYAATNPWIDVAEITQVDVLPVDSNTRWISRATLLRVGGGFTTADSLKYDSEATAGAVSWRIRITSGTCQTDTTIPFPYPPNFNDPIPYTDPTTQCTYNITPQGFVTESEGGGAGFVMKIEAAGPQTLASGGVVGGCNFEPTLVSQPPGGGPPTTIPWDPTWPDWDGGGIPPWLTALIGAAGGVGGTIITNLINQLFETKYPAGNRTIRAACEYKEDGTPETFTVNYPEEPYQARVLTALDAITDFQQQILLWKTPTCSGGGSSVTGDAVSINWVSDEYSAAGGNRIRKLLTYFDQVGSTLEQTVAHWKDFTWNAGSVIVSVNGVPLGKPQVWAESADEGKRVINHAAAIAGVDMTKAEWLITSPRSSRYGQPGLMRVHRSNNGILGITKRDGPSGPPMGLT
jgi:hypothetical protein